jgi:hypothetical protein
MMPARFDPIDDDDRADAVELLRSIAGRAQNLASSIEAGRATPGYVSEKCDQIAGLARRVHELVGDDPASTPR